VSNPLSRLRAIATSNRGQHIPSLLDYVALDVERVAQDMRLQERGTERGGSGEPMTSSQTLDSVEREIVDKIQSEQQSAVEQVTEQFNISSARLRHLQFDSIIFNVKADTAAAVSDFEQEGRNGWNLLHSLRRKLIEATNALEDFKDRNNITRPAHAKPDPLTTCFILAVIFLIETLSNALLIGGAHQSGYIGAYTLALSLSFINVLCGFAAGLFGLRSVYHTSAPIKVWGLLSVATYLAFIFIFNLYVSYVRDAMQSGGLQESLTQVWTRLWTPSIDFQSFEAPVMLIIGITFSLVAFYKGFRNDDPFPDYGRQSRLRDETEQDYASMTAQLGERLSDNRNDIRQTLQDVANELGMRRSKYFEIMSIIRRFTGRFHAHERQLESSARRLLNIYRDANKEARKTGEPRHFRREYDITVSDVVSPDIDGIFSIEDVESLIKKGNELLANSIEKIDEVHQRTFKSYDLISQILDMGELEKAKSDQDNVVDGNDG
jgi:hypothetical protein